MSRGSDQVEKISEMNLADMAFMLGYMASSDGDLFDRAYEAMIKTKRPRKEWREEISNATQSH